MSARPPRDRKFLTDLRAEIYRSIVVLPPRGKPAADMTERERLAVAIAAGVPVETAEAAGILTVRTTRPVGTADGADGRWVVVVGPPSTPRERSATDGAPNAKT